MADALAQRGAEEAMKDTCDERRGAAITHEICKGAGPTKLDRPPHLPNQLIRQRREKRRQLEYVSGHNMRKVKGQWVCHECWCSPGKYSLVEWLKAN
eukprot:7227985-Pyramimonas_sp.AAC.1